MQTARDNQMIHTVILRQMLPRYRRIGVVSSVMHAMQRCWRQQAEIEFGHKTYKHHVKRLQPADIICQHSPCVGTIQQNLKNSGLVKSQSFHMGCHCQRQMLGVRWQDHAKNVDSWPAEHC